MGEKFFICDFDGCGCVFLDFSVFVRYKWIYMGEKLYICDFNGCV